MRSPILPFLAALLPAASGTRAQPPAHQGGFTCLGDDPVGMEHHWATNPGAREHALRAEAELGRRTANFTRERDGEPYIISVVVHIIHNGGPENITDAQVHDGIRILNEDFGKRNPDWPGVRPEFLPLVAEVGIEFRLARKDPNGDCTNGITRTQSRLTHVGDTTMTRLIQWPRDRYLNVWVAASARGAAGYARYPSRVDNWPEGDGIVLLHGYMGSIGTGMPSRSRALTHEVGHWLNLMHTWGNSNDAGLDGNCAMDDEVDDTPLTRGWTSCVLNGSSCGSPLDNVENYMEYAYCQKMFTPGQADRMLAALTAPVAQRDRLWQPETLLSTGVLDSLSLCAARFTHTRTEICAGGTVTFTDVSYHRTTGRTWDFPGGVPGTSTDSIPTVRYDTPGTHSVTLTANDGTDSRTIIGTDLVRVLPDTGHAMPWSEGFEDPDALGDWVVRDQENDGTWEVTEAAAFSGARSARIGNAVHSAGHIDELRSPTLDMSAAASITISFRHAFARRTAGNDDRLRVHVSNDCGTTWSLRLQMRGSTTLPTGDDNTGDFTPTRPEEWHLTELTNISAAYRTRNFRVRLEFESDGGNNLYLDDININGSPLGMEGPAPADGRFILAPNPAGDLTRAVLTLQEAGPVRIDVMDALGRLLGTPHNGRLPAGTHRVDLPLTGLQRGMYLVRLRSSGLDATLRLMVR